MSRLVAWSPHASTQFAVASAEVRLYELCSRNTNNNTNNNSALLPKQEIRLLSVQASSEVSWIRCLSWCPDARDPTLVALGLPNGRVRLMDMLPGLHATNNNATLTQQQQHENGNVFASQDRTNLVTATAAGTGSHSPSQTGWRAPQAAKEFVPKNSRACNALAWNPVHTNRIAAALDRVRGDFSTIVWDINQTPGVPMKTNAPSRVANRLIGRSPSSNSVNKSKGGGTLVGAAAPSGAADSTESPRAMDLGSGIHLSAPADTAEMIVTPSFELGSNDSTVALSWVPRMPDCMVTGTGSKWMRLYDLRKDHNAPQHVVAHSRAVYGVTFNPFRDTQLLTFSDDGLVKLWDARYFTRAMASFSVSQRGLQDVQWCPTRPDLIATVIKGEPNITFWDVRAVTEAAAGSAAEMVAQATMVDEPDNSDTPSAAAQTFNLKPSRVFDTPDPPASIAWNKQNQHRMLCAGVSGSVEILTLQEAIPISWCSSAGSLSFAFGRYIQEVRPFAKPEEALKWDVSTLMQARARSGYSMDPLENVLLLSAELGATSGLDLALLKPTNEEVFFPSAYELLTFWVWMRDYLSEKFFLKTTVAEDSKDSGRANAANSSTGGIPSSVVSAARTAVPDGTLAESVDLHDAAHYSLLSAGELPQFVGINATLALLSAQPSRHVKQVGDKQLMFGIYSAPARNTCLQLCGWGFEKRDLDATLLRLEERNEFERAAAVALFHLDIKRAIACLTRGSSDRRSTKSNASAPSPAPHNMDTLRVVAMALSGFQPKASVWRETCLDPDVFGSIHHPYLRACFAFLCKDESTSFKRVLMNDFEDLELVDKIGFACRFLDDTDLLEFVETAGQKLTQRGRLEGLLLVGLTPRGVDLFQQYVNRTGDVQTAALALSHVVPAHFEDARAQRWRKCYRSLLDQWRLWHVRALFDISAGAALASSIKGRDEISSVSIPSQVYVRCNICDTSIAAPMVAARRGAAALGGGRGGRGRGAGSLGASRFSPSRFARNQPNSAASGPSATPMVRGASVVQRRQMTACPSCHRSLPRCAICLLTYNVALPVAPNSALGGRTQRPDGTELDEWFTWCQSCRHGGHAKHIEEWFDVHDQCPVTDCECRCAVL